MTASPSATSGARLKKMVIAGKSPWWFTCSGARLVPNLVTAVSGTMLPEAPRT